MGGRLARVIWLVMLGIRVAACGKLAKLAPLKVSVPQGSSGGEAELKIEVPTRGRAAGIATPAALFNKVEQAWKAVVETNAVGLEDPKAQGSGNAVALSPEEAWHHWSAAQQGIVDSARFLVTFGAVASLQAGGSLLHTTAALGQVDQMRSILDDPDNMLDIDVPKELDGTTPLHSAISSGQLEAVKFLIEQGANVEARGNNGVTPLMLASSLGNAPIVDLLLSIGGALVNAQHSFANTTALHFAAEMGREQVLLSLCNAGADANAEKSTGGTPLHTAADTNQTIAARILVLHCGADVHKLLVKDTTPLYLAAQRGLTEMCSILIDELGANPNFEMPRGENIGNSIQLADKKNKNKVFYPSKNTELGNGATALHAAAENGHSLTVQSLLERGALSTASMQGATPLVISLQYRHPDIALKILQHDSDPLVNAKVPIDGSSALLVATEMASRGPVFRKVLHVLLSRTDIDVDIDNNRGVTSLSHVLSKGTDVETANALLDAGATIYASNPPAIYAAALSLREPDLIQRLLSAAKHETPSVADEHDQTALHIAAASGNQPMITALVEYGTPVDVRVKSSGVTPLMIASKEGNFESVAELTRLGAQINLKAYDSPLFGATALYLASQNNNLRVVRFLLEQHAEPDLPLYEYGATPLFVAAERGHTAIISELLRFKHSLDVDRTLPTGLNSVAVAVLSNHYEATRILIEAGAKTDISFKRNHDPEGEKTLFQLGLQAGKQCGTKLINYLAEATPQDPDECEMDITLVLRVQTSSKIARKLNVAKKLLQLVLDRCTNAILPVYSLFIIMNAHENGKDAAQTKSLLQVLFNSELWAKTDKQMLFLHAEQLTQFVSPLQSAVKRNKLPAIRYLLDHVEEVSVLRDMLETDKTGALGSPLSMARDARNFPMLKLLESFRVKANELLNRDEL